MCKERSSAAWAIVMGTRLRGAAAVCRRVSQLPASAPGRSSSANAPDRLRPDVAFQRPVGPLPARRELDHGAFGELDVAA